MRLPVLVFVVLLSASLTGHASPGKTAPPHPQVYGGEPSETCNFPTTVALFGSGGFMCSGTLVAPQVVVYASHCGAQIQQIVFGEDIDSPARTVVPQSCKIYPDADIYAGSDWAYCKLAEPITDIPITPILMGCERGVLQEGKSVFLVGFGQDDAGDYGIKRQAEAVQHQVEDNKAWIGGDGRDECFGDSGSSAYVQLTADTDGVQGDGTWRVYSITSYTPAEAGAACGAGTFHSLIPNAVPWIEADTGLDITPCHDADGTWNPGPLCANFPKAPATQSGSWSAHNSCQVGDVGGFGATCGASWAP